MLESAVIGWPHPDVWQGGNGAMVDAQDGSGAGRGRDHCGDEGQKLRAAFKVPKRVFVVNELPGTRWEKCRKGELGEGGIPASA